MKMYQVVTIVRNDEFEDYRGNSYEEALKAKHKALFDYEHSSPNDKKYQSVECRVYDIPDDTDIFDNDSVINAMVDCIGYDLF